MTEPQPIDLDQLNMVSNNDPYDREFLVSIYLRETEKELKKLFEAIQTANVKEVYRLAHGCAGSSMSYGMAAVVPALKELEAMAKESNLQNPAALCEEVQRQFQRVQTFAQTLSTADQESKAA